MDKVSFSCTALAGTNKTGILKPDANGYYTMPIGGLNVYNSRGDYYTMEGAEQLFRSDSSFMRRVRDGCLKAEFGHPTPLPGQTYESFAARVMSIKEDNTCATISEVWLDNKNIKDRSGKPVIAIMGRIKPSGLHKHVLEDAFANPEEDVCFSIRSITEDRKFGGVTRKILKQIVTFDYVTEPGINFARKYHAPSLESLVETEFTREQLHNVLTHNLVGVGQESARNISLELFQNMNWNLGKDNIPKWVNW